MTGLIITLVVLAVLLLLALLFLVPRRRRARVERQRVEARNHLNDSQVLAAQAEQGRAAAEEAAARARRERAELEERLIATREALLDHVERTGTVGVAAQPPLLLEDRQLVRHRRR